MDFQNFPENFRRITTQTYGILEIFRKFSKNYYTHLWDFRKFPQILAIDSVGYFTDFFFVRTKKMLQMVGPVPAAAAAAAAARPG